MRKRSRSEQLDTEITAMLTSGEGVVPSSNTDTAGLIRIASELRYLPHETFKQQLKENWRNPTQ